MFPSSIVFLSLLSSATAAQEPGIGACCYSATCLADKHCAPGCGTAALPCSNDSCKNCECCPCCSGTTDSCAATAPNTPPFQPASAECCKTGYSGPGCADPACDESCGSHGKCSAPNVCTCDAGWGGTLCNEAVCNGKTVGGCGPNGKCTAPNTCVCDAGHRNPADACNCDAGWGGPNCETAVCNGGCGPNGKCTAPNTCTCNVPAIHRNASDMCVCDDGWGGANCDQAVCDGGCGHGTCGSPNNCTCSAGWSGPHCAAPVCTTPCGANGNCTVRFGEEKGFARELSPPRSCASYLRPSFLLLLFPPPSSPPPGAGYLYLQSSPESPKRDQ